MTTRKIFAVLIIFLIISCSDKTRTSSLEKTLNGTIERDLFTNDYLTLTIKDGWTELEGNDEGQFLVISKLKENFNSNIIFLALVKKIYTEQYGYKNAEQYMIGLTDNFISKPNYKLLTGVESLNINGQIFFVSKFLLTKGEKEYKQVYYTTEVDNYFIGIVTTDDNKQLEPEVEKTIESIMFR